MVPEASLLSAQLFSWMSNVPAEDQVTSLTGTERSSQHGPAAFTIAADCTGTLSPAPGIAPTFNIYVGPGAQQVWTIQSGPDGEGNPGVSRGTAVRLP